jgi:general stress protein 26
MNPAIKIIKPGEGSSEEEIRAMIWYFLDTNNKMALSFIDEVGEPKISFMLYAIDDDLNLYFGTLKSFIKYKSLNKKPILAAMIQEEKREPVKVVNLRMQIEEEIDDKERLKKLLKWFATKNACKYYIKDREDFVMFKAKTLSARLTDGSFGRLIRYDLNLLN